jgi:GNAT superfamily N-acetyltransferase
VIGAVALPHGDAFREADQPLPGQRHVLLVDADHQVAAGVERHGELVGPAVAIPGQRRPATANAELLALRVERGPVGRASAYRNITTPEPDFGEVSLLHVHPDHRGRGQGAALFAINTRLEHCGKGTTPVGGDGGRQGFGSGGVEPNQPGSRGGRNYREL